MRIDLLAFNAIFCVMLTPATMITARAEEIEVAYVRPYPIVMYSKAAEEELKPFARDVARFNGNAWVQAAEFNPVCYVWLEFAGTPSPGEPGYIILHQRGGTVIQASNAEQMKAALVRWRATSKEASDGVVFPIGLTTSYKVIE